MKLRYIAHQIVFLFLLHPTLCVVVETHFDRIHAVLRRFSATQTPERLRVGDLVLDHTTHTVSLNALPVELTPTEFNLLAILMGAPGRAFTREALFNRLMDTGFDGLEKTINVHIRNLRTKIEPDPAEPIYVETVFGVGYRLRKS